MDLRLGLSLLLLLTYFSSTQSKNTRDGPNLRQRHTKRATLSEFLQPPAPSNFLKNPPTILAPPPPPPPPLSSFRTGRFVTDPRPEDRPSRGYFSRLLGWLNPWSSDGLQPPPQSTAKNPIHQEPSFPKNGPFQNDKSCNPCNEIPWIPIRGNIDGPVNNFPANFNNYKDNYYQPTPSIEIRQPDFAFPQNLYPEGSNNLPIPNPHIYPGAMPPLYRSEPFGTGGPYSASQGLPGNDFHHRQETSNFGPSDSGAASTNIQESVQVQGKVIQVEENQNQRVQVQENQNQGRQEQNQNLGVQEQSQNQGVQEQNREQIQQQIQNQGIQEQRQNQRIQQQNQNQAIHEQSQNQEIQQQNQNQGIHEQRRNQWIQQQNQNQAIHEQSQNQEIQQQNQNQGIHEQRRNQWIQQQNQNLRVQEQSQNQGIQQQIDNQRIQQQSLNQWIQQENQNQEVQQQNQNQEIQQQNQNQEIQQQNQNKWSQDQPNQNKGIQQQNLNQWIQQENQNQEVQQQNQNQEIQQQNQNQEIQQQNQNKWSQDQPNQNEGVQEQNQNQGPSIREIQGQEIQHQQNQGYQSEKEQLQSQLELVPSIGGQVSSEQIHFEKSSLIDLTISSTTPTPLTFTQSVTIPSNFGKVPEALARPSSLIDYLVSGFNDRIPAVGSTGTKALGSTGTGLLGSESIGSTGSEGGAVESNESDLVNQGQDQESYGTLGYNENRSFMEEFMESYYNFKKEEALNASRAQATNSASSGTSGEDLLYSTPSSRAVKRNKQVQIIIPYTSQDTPSPFHSSFNDDRNGRVMGQNLPRKVPSMNQFDHFDDNVLAQESKTFAVTSLPDISSSIKPVTEKGKNNSIDVQRLQKNIDNWTIQEYSSGMKASTVLPNGTRPYLSHSKKIPNEYFTTMEPNNTSDEIYDFEDYKQMTTFEISRVPQASTPKTTTTKMPKIEASSEEPRKSIILEAKENRTETGSSENYFPKVYPVFQMSSTTSKDDEVPEVTSVPIGKKESKKVVEVKKKPKKKDSEKIERAYQVLPQAVNNLAVASTGPEKVPLWGIMEHEEFAAVNSDHELPILYTGHSKVSYSRR